MLLPSRPILAQRKPLTLNPYSAQILAKGLIPTHTAGIRISYVCAHTVDASFPRPTHPWILAGLHMMPHAITCILHYTQSQISHTCTHTGDLLGSGTISGPGPHECGCLLEATQNGQHPLQLRVEGPHTSAADGHTSSGAHTRGACPGSGLGAAGEGGGEGSVGESTRGAAAAAHEGETVSRAYLQDGDTVVLRGWCEREGLRVGFGECRGMLLPAARGG